MNFRLHDVHDIVDNKKFVYSAVNPVWLKGFIKFSVSAKASSPTKTNGSFFSLFGNVPGSGILSNLSINAFPNAVLP